ncbi:MAG: hypothetical protein ACRECV_07440 [Xanthobacteraceae bacterium]
MSWSTVPFGKYNGKTLPEIIVGDLDWFYWALTRLYGWLGEEAQFLARRAQAIRIPRRDWANCEIEYQYDRGGGFRGFRVVEVDNPLYSKWATRLPHLDLSLACHGKSYDKGSGRRMIRDFSHQLFR